ncbi:MAG TPA: alpha/beta fold hydrolase [Anaerolineales bacterium]|nr:alpha/beta fold hydrolase [Anaerolineales bacterium]HLO30962.1 alpha/beta fold hydrolase [Anaerolineales bacterium]
MKKTMQYKYENTISYAEYGDQNGYPILINHGLIASINDYDLFERLIQQGAHLICMARPGYGESSPYVMQNFAEWADIVAVLIDELNLSQFDVLGMSSGAPYSYSIGYKFPDKVRNIYMFSGIPALYDEKVLSYWPYEVKRNASIAEMELLAYELFFSKISKEDMEKNDIKDSMRNNCFGIAQDLRLRGMDWGFRLQDISENVTMQHSKEDQAVPFITALLTSQLLPNCKLIMKEHGEHFSKEALDDFIKTVIARNYESEKYEDAV